MSGEIMDLFDGLHESGMTLAVITHDHDVSHRAGRQVSIIDGTLLES